MCFWGASSPPRNEIFPRSKGPYVQLAMGDSHAATRNRKMIEHASLRAEWFCSTWLEGNMSD